MINENPDTVTFTNLQITQCSIEINLKTIILTINIKQLSSNTTSLCINLFLVCQKEKYVVSIYFLFNKINV